MPNWWSDITRDPLTQHVVAKDLFKAHSFYAGLLYLVGLVPAARCGWHEDLPIGPGVFLLAMAFGTQALKEGSKYLDRKTADGAGNPLAQPGTFPPVPMPQEENPNVKPENCP